jgi:hypothetical protein
MPNIYDIAGGQGMQFAQPFSAMVAARQAKANHRLTEAQALVMETNVANDARDYALEDRKVKVSEGGLDVARERNVIDAKEFGLKYDIWRDKQFNGMSEDAQRAFKFWEDNQATAIELYEQALKQGASEEQAIQMANAPFAHMQAQMPSNMKGKALFDPNIGRAVRARENQSDASKPRSLGQRVVELPGQKPVEGEVFIEGDRMYIQDANGKQTNIGSFQATTPTARTQTGELPDAERGRLNDAEVNTMNYIEKVQDAVKLLDTEKDANTLVARLAGTVNDLQTEAEAFARKAGIGFNTKILDPEGYTDTFDALGIKNAQMKSLVTNLAFQKALASSQAGRDVSNADVERFMREIGATHADPRAFKTVLLDTATRMDRNFRNNYKVRMKEEFKGDLGLSKLTGPKIETINGVQVEFLD